jgi:hypothetical protein
MKKSLHSPRGRPNGVFVGSLPTSKRNFRPDDLAAGRDYVASYVSFVHYVEGLHEASSSTAAGHYAEDEQPAES